jgi:hypothetical protein
MILELFFKALIFSPYVIVGLFRLAVTLLTILFLYFCISFLLQSVSADPFPEHLLPLFALFLLNEQRGLGYRLLEKLPMLVKFLRLSPQFRY